MLSAEDIDSIKVNNNGDEEKIYSPDIAESQQPWLSHWHAYIFNLIQIQGTYRKKIT